MNRNGSHCSEMQLKAFAFSSSNYFNHMRFSQIRWFPSRQQPIEDFMWNADLTRSILRGQAIRPGFNVNYTDSRVVGGAQINTMIAHPMADVGGIPDE